MAAAAALLMTRAGLAQTPPAPQAPAQTPPAPQGPAQTPASLLNGTVERRRPLHDRPTATQARYERYRDDRDGVRSSFSLNRHNATSLFDASASHIGYRDQQYNVAFTNRRVNFTFRWDSIPLNYSYITRTPYAGERRHADAG